MLRLTGHCVCRLDAMAEEAEQRRQAEEQAQLHALRQQQSRQEPTEPARLLQQPQQQAIGQPRGSDDRCIIEHPSLDLKLIQSLAAHDSSWHACRFLDALRGAEAANAR